jgi:biotin carboxyl carrier protein
VASARTGQDGARMKTYKIQARNRTITVVVAPDGSATVNGEHIDHTLTRLHGDQWLLRIGDRTFEISPPEPGLEEDERVVFVNGRAVSLRVEDERAVLLRAVQGEKATHVHHAAIRAPMPGRVTRLLVSEGELIETGQGLLLLEAMKMENEIKSPVAGVVKRIRIEAGSAVEKNAILIDIH